MTLSAAEYARGVIWLLAVLGSLGVAAVVVRKALVPGWSGAAARLVEAVVLLTLLQLVARILGALSVFRWGAFLALAIAVGGASIAGARLLAERISPAQPPPFPSPATGIGQRGQRAETIVATAALAVVAAQWCTHVAEAMAVGMTHADTLWYHGPFTARFLQTGGFGELGSLGYPESRYFPLDAELLHATLTMPFQRDVLVPLTNGFFAALALCAAWCVGRRFGAGALAVLATTMVLGLPTLAGTQPGQASNDVMVAALLMTAVALAVESGHRPVPIAFAGAALGLAVATKLTIAAPAVVLAVGGLIVLLRDHRHRAALLWTASIALVGSFWFVRNWILTGSPLPFVELSIGRFHLAGPAAVEGRASLVSTLDDLGEWQSWYRDGLRAGFGWLWFVVLGVVVGGALVTAVRRSGMIRVAALAVLAGVAVFPFMPLTGELPFRFNIRYLTPTMLLAMPIAAVAAATARRPTPWRIGLTVACAAVVVVDLGARHHERTAAWPGHWWMAMLGAAAVVLAVLAIRRPPAVSRRPLAAIAAGAVGVVVLAGWPVQRHYLSHRYVDAGLVDAPLNAYFRGVSGQRVDVLGTPETYPFFGADLSNDVTDHSGDPPPDEPSPGVVCRYWRSTLRPGPRLIAVSGFGFLAPSLTAPEREVTFASAPGVATELEDGERAVYRVDVSLDPDGCPR
jgi:hypothetical protein